MQGVALILDWVGRDTLPTDSSSIPYDRPRKVRDEARGALLPYGARNGYVYLGYNPGGGTMREYADHIQRSPSFTSRDSRAKGQERRAYQEELSLTR